MVNFVEHLSDHGMDAVTITAAVPADDRVVTAHDVCPLRDLPLSANMRYRDGRWYGALSNEDLTARAWWSESVFFTVNSVGNHRNTK